MSHRPAAADHDRPCPTGPSAHDAARFLTRQTGLLAAAVADGASVDLDGVLASQDAAHERWLAVIAEVKRRDDDAAEAVEGLYAWTGRVAGTLEREAQLPLPEAVATEVRTGLGVRLLVLAAAALQAAQGAFAVVSDPSGLANGTSARSPVDRQVAPGSTSAPAVVTDRDVPELGRAAAAT